MPIAYKEACDRIEDLVRFAKKNSEEHTRGCLRRLGSPDKACRLIHVAGTNGKGSVCAFLAEMLKQSGLRCGLFISPHLVTTRERIRIDGCPISETAFVKAYERVATMVRTLEEEGEPGPSYFEYLFLMAMTVFEEAGVAIAVLETGLGGRLDATNAVEAPLLSVITNIALDHTAYLGSTIPEIAAEKAGIIKAGRPVVYDAHNQEAAAVIEAAARRLGCQSVPADPAAYRIETVDGDGLTFSHLTKGEALICRIPFPAPYEAANAHLALTAAEVLKEEDPDFFRGLTEKVQLSALARTQWEGRMEKAADRLYLDGAHNPDGMAAFTEAVSAMKLTGDIFVIFGAAGDKDYPQMLRMLTEKVPVTAAFTVKVAGARGAEPEDLCRLFYENGVAAVPCDGAADALNQALARRGDGTIFVIGSLYLVGEMKALIGLNEDQRNQNDQF